MNDPLPPLDPLSPDLKPLSELLDRLPTRPSPPTRCRWILRGAGGTSLRTLKICGRHYSTEAELRRFLTVIQRTPTPSPLRDVAAMSRRLSEAGYGPVSPRRCCEV